MLCSIEVPAAWFERGATLQISLPRLLSCARCDGGGCDVCERSGGVTLRQRGEPADLVQVSLPAERHETFVIRLPERGGLPPVESGLPRGHLLLRVEPSAEADASVTLAVRHPVIEVARRVLSVRPVLSPRRRLWLGAALVGVLLLAIWLLFGR